MTWHLYLLQCGPCIYTGITTDVEARVAAHAAGKGARFTRGRAEQRLLFQVEVGTRSEALRLERAVKRLGHAAKVDLAEGRRELPEPGRAGA
ncbi:MAG TPA: GIY-YIG nuclease family protein [Holophaga sp.]|nr:GIY-YIG nuclease family protein [Holophaga sp.]